MEALDSIEKYEFEIYNRYLSIDTPGGMVEPEELTNFIKSLCLDGNSMVTSSKIKDIIVIDQKFDYLYRRESGEFVAKFNYRRQKRQFGLFTKRTS